LPRYQASATGWRKAGHSSRHGVCAEIARTPALGIRPGAWLVFAAGLKRG
jgi:hypothetical protein